MLMKCPECNGNVSDKAISCPHCGFPIASGATVITTPKTMTRKKKHKKLPNGFGSIKKLSGKRNRPYAVYPPVKNFNLNGSPEALPAIGYFADWYSAFDALHEYNKNPYDIKTENITFAELFDMYYKAKFISDKKKKYSDSTIYSTNAAFKNCAALHNRTFKELRKPDLQSVVDNCPLKHSSLELIVSLFKQMYKFAKENDIIEKDYSEFVKINIADDDERGVPFSREELDILWKHSDLADVRMILIMIYTGYRIKAFETININFEQNYFQGGVKTAAGKDRIVPIHPCILPFVEEFSHLHFTAINFRAKHFYPALKSLGISMSVENTKHTPHDCRHTFSWLCDKYKVDDLSKHLMMGHTLGKDIEKSIYGHRTLDELRAEINKIQV